jgi:uncharacterized protein
MAQFFDPLPSDAQDKKLCCYTNATSKIQIARITNIPNWYFERVVFPGQRLVFEALPEALLEIHSGMMSAVLADTIPCDRLTIELELEADLVSSDVAEIESERALTTVPSQAIATNAIRPGRVGQVEFRGTVLPAQVQGDIAISPGETVDVIEESLTLIVEPPQSSRLNFEENPIKETWKSNDDELPLIDLFTRLREAGLPLGIYEYRLLIKALQSGFGVASKETLADLCRTLWIKSADEDRLFNYHFDRVFVSKLERLDKQRDSDKVPVDSATKSASESDAFSKKPLFLKDELQLAGAIQTRANTMDETFVNRFTQSDEYFPVTRRQMKQNWRYLRTMVREGSPSELDIDATVAQIERLGMLLEPVLVPRRINKAELLLLIDQKGSMVPFHALSQRLAETAQREGRLGQLGVYYFHNCPTKFIYHEPSLKRADNLSNVLDKLRSNRSVVLIFSDAGAARGGFSSERLDLTEGFLMQLRQQVHHVAWLNPIPQTRWKSSTAAEIAQIVPMFEMNRRGMEEAIEVLCGRVKFTKIE